MYVSVSVLWGLQSAHPPSPVVLLRHGTCLPGGGSYVRDLSCASCGSRLLFPYLVRFRSLLVHSFQVCVICEGVFKSCLLYSMWSGLLVIPGVSTLPCLPLMLSLKTIILNILQC